MTSGPGRSSRWYVLARRTLEPAVLSDSTVWLFTVAWVPTGMKIGVFTSPWRVVKVAARARDPEASASSLNLRRDTVVSSEP
jgi:hypothetical protein